MTARKTFDGVLILGAGLAGLSAALACAPRKTLVLSPEPLTQGCSSAWAQGGMAAALSPAVTVIDQDPIGLGRIAVERLLQRIEDPGAQVRRRTVLPVSLIPRGSGELPPAAP